MGEARRGSRWSRWAAWVGLEVRRDAESAARMARTDAPPSPGIGVDGQTSVALGFFPRHSRRSFALKDRWVSFARVTPAGRART